MHGHFVYLSGIVLLNVSQDADVFDGDKVDGHSFSTKSTSSTNSVDIIFTVAIKKDLSVVAPSDATMSTHMGRS
jgi:hypothetical protein